MSNSSIAAQIKAALDNYSLDLQKSMEKLARSEASRTAKDLNEASGRFDAGKTRIPYSQSWKSKAQGDGYTVYSRVPGLPHLLENGHAVVSHGRVSGNVGGVSHIASVADEHEESFEEQARRLVGK